MKERTVREVKQQPQVLLPNARSDVRDFFAKTKVLTERRPHNQFLVFVPSRFAVVVHVVDAARKLEQFEDDCKVMVQWPGKWRSDWFQSTVGEILDARDARWSKEQERA